MSQPEGLEGQRVDQYVIQRHLDRGGMADVYLAFDTSLQRQVAMKMMLPHLAQDDDYVARFRREATTVAGLQHPYIIQVYDVGMGPDERPYFTMQYIKGGSLQRWLAQLQQTGQTMPVPFALDLAVKIADALQTAHDAGIVHRDLKPANILLGTNTQPLLTDLGVARTGDTRLTQTGAAVGTPLYMAPEQMSGHADVRSDIYAFGVMLHEMLAGEVPLQRPLPDSLLEQTRTVVQRCLQPNPDDRFQSAAQLKVALAAALREERARTVDTRPMQAITQRLTPRHLLWAVPVLLLLFAAGAYLFFSAGLPRETAVASPSPQPVNLAADVPVATPTSALPASPVPTLTPLPTSTPTPTPSPTPTASPTPTITPTAVVMPTLAPALVGPAPTPLVTEDATAVRLNQPPVIDAYLEDWAQVVPILSAFRVYEDEAWDGRDDITAVWRLGWDEINLYIGVIVDDDVHVQVQTGRKNFLGDSLEMQLDTNREADFAPEVNLDDYQITFSPGNFDTIPASAYRFRGTENNRMLDATDHAIQIVSRQTGNGYVIEAAIPWSDINVTPVEGQVLGVALNVTDNDSPGTAVQEVFYSHVSTRTFLDPTSWGTLTLKTSN